jgi:hypothetical protein
MADIIVNEFFNENPNLKENQIEDKLYIKLKKIFNMEDPNDDEIEEIEKIIYLTKKRFYANNEKISKEIKKDNVIINEKQKEFSEFVKKMAEILMKASTN